jgi:hypothetical protein
MSSVTTPIRLLGLSSSLRRADQTASVRSSRHYRSSGPLSRCSGLSLPGQVA